jgi:hypothetical protein
VRPQAESMFLTGMMAQGRRLLAQSEAVDTQEADEV